MATPSNHGSNAYLKTKVMTASPAELRLMLLDGAIRFSEQARRGYAERDFESAFEGTTRAQNIVLELINALKPDKSPEVCARLSALYTFMYKSLVEASMKKDPVIVDEVLKLLRYERETWQLCLAKLAGETRTAGGADAAASEGLSIRG
jgi:flagellar protein FliS